MKDIKIKIELQLLSDYNDILTIAIFSNGYFATIIAGNVDEVFSRLKKLKERVRIINGIQDQSSEEEVL